MTRSFCVIAFTTTVAVLLSACVSIPGSESDPANRYDLTGVDSPCESGQKILGLSIVRVGAGLDKNRIARRDARSGEVTYLKGVRWVESSAALLEQRLAGDLECRGYSVITSHRRNLAHSQLSCEVRNFNLVSDSGNDRAQVSLSCLLSTPGEKNELAVGGQGQKTLQNWDADSAVAAINDAYQQAFITIADTIGHRITK